MARLSKKIDDNFYIKFCPKDWLSDTKLRLCSAAAKGIWIDLLCLMHDENPRGVVTSDLKKLTRLLGYEKEEIESALLELHKQSVLSLGREIDPRLPEKAIVSRRMYRENIIKTTRSEAGKKGAEARWNADGKKWQTLGKPLAKGIANDVANQKQQIVNKNGAESDISHDFEHGKAMANAQQSDGLIVIVRDRVRSVSDEDTPSLVTRAREIGNPVQVGEALLGVQTNPLHFESLLHRVFEVSMDGPKWRGWWCQVMECIRGEPELLGCLEANLEYVEDCQDDTIREIKGLGKLRAPGAYLTSKVLFAARSRRIRLPDLPKPEGEP